MGKDFKRVTVWNDFPKLSMSDTSKMAWAPIIAHDAGTAKLVST